MSSAKISGPIPSPAAEFLSGGGDMGALIRAKDWTQTPVGTPEVWPQSLRTALGILLDSGYAMYIAWGREFTQFYNDAYRPILGQTKHPSALGESTLTTFPEIWEFIGPMFRRVMDYGQSTSLSDQLLPLNRNGFLEECYFTFSYSAIRAEAGTVGGVFVTVIETTERVLAERRLQTLRELAAQVADTRDAGAGITRAAATLGKNRFDVPFALFYLLDAAGQFAILKDGCGFDESECEKIRRFEVADPDNPLPFATVAESGVAVRIEDLRGFSCPQTGVWPEPVRSALMLPLSGWGPASVSGFLIVGISPRLELKESYESFLHLAANHVSSALSNAHSYAEERRRAEALADVDRAKTAFFSNVSHEFRTPLTLMLGPLEELLNSDSLAEEGRQKVALAHRNSLRLLKLVNTLLDFSRIEAGRVSAAFEPVDLREWTCDLCSVFRSAIEKAGLRFQVECEELPEAVYVDRGMWEKIVLNLLSNAFKFTFEGVIAIRQQADGPFVKLEIEDTGTGIPAAELPHLFERFHRVEGARGRTFEGTGIGLALVAELVKLHGGTIQVTSVPAKGSTFSVRIPFGKQHLPAERLREARSSSGSSAARNVFVEEGEGWLPEAERNGFSHAADAPPSANAKQRVLVADDNADMRTYVAHLLGSEYDVMTVSNGEEALEAIRKYRPVLLLSDVMMPKLDGIGLIRRIRAQEETRSLPVILLSARVGEEARLDGLAAGADDYLQKPFGAKELLARTKLQLEMANARDRVSKLEHSLVAQADGERRRWQCLLMQAPAMIAVLRGPGHVFELANPSYLRAVARTSEELIGKPLREALPELNTQPFPGILDQVYSSGKAYVENELCALLDLKGTGILEPRYFNLAYQPSFDSQARVDGILVHATDVTDQVQARHAVEKSERQLRTLAEAIPQLVWSCLPDGQCDYLSAQWVSYTGVPQSEQTGYRWLDLVIHPEDRERVAAAWAAAVQDNARYDLEYRIRRFDGAYRWFKTRGTPVRDAAGKILKWFGTCTDIEDALNAAAEREALLKREQAARATAELLNRVGPALVGELDPQRLVQRVTDLATELAGAEFGALVHNLTDEKGQSRMLSTLSGAAKDVFVDFPMLHGVSAFAEVFRGDGVVLCGDVTNDARYSSDVRNAALTVRSYLAVPVVSRRGELLGGLFFGHSLPRQFTAQHATLVSGIAAQAAIALDNANLFAEAQRTQVELETTNTVLRQANADLEQFAYAAAHDLQEPLRMVTTYSELLARRIGRSSDEKVSTYVKYVTNASTRMILLLQDLLAYTETTRQSELPPRSVDLEKVLEKALANVAAALAESEAVIEAHALPTVLGREAGFVQLFQNLLSNAIKYRSPERQPVIRITSEVSGGTARICVRDNGIGIAPEYHHQIFGVFRRLHGSEIPGTGIGLAICQRVVERAGGRLWVESEVGKGAAFFVELSMAVG